MTTDRPWIAILAGAAGAAVAIAAMEFLAERSAVPLAFIPFATSIVLVMGWPDAKPAQPRALVAGHLLSAAIGLLVVTIAGPQVWAAPIAVGIAIVVMRTTDSFHPPAGINPLLIVLNDRSWSFLIVPVAAGSFCWWALPIFGITSCAADRGRIDGGRFHYFALGLRRLLLMKSSRGERAT